MLMFTQSGKLTASVIKRNGAIESNYKQGVVIYNDDTTTIEFVINVIRKYFGLKMADAKLAANIINLRGSMLFEVDSTSIAEHIIKSISKDATEKGAELKSEIVIAQQDAPADAKRRRG
jgi:ATP-dependent Clp protease adapter protein ClpS